MIDTGDHRRFERIDAVRATRRGLEADLHGEQLRVEVVRDDVVRLRISRGGRFDEGATYAVVGDLRAPVEVVTEVTDARATVTTSALCVTVGRDPFRIDVHRADGSAVLETAVDAAGHPWTYAVLNDSFTLRRRRAREDAVFGLGEKGGAFERSGRDLVLWNTDVLAPDAVAAWAARAGVTDLVEAAADPAADPMYVAIPLLYHQAFASGAMSASFVDNAHRSVYELSGGVDVRLHFSGGQYDEYVFAGPRMPDILERYTELTGRAPLPPLWALGFHQCRWHHDTQESVLSLARRHRELGLPADVVWLDIEHMDGYRVFTWDRTAFPDPPRLLADLRELGFRAVTIVDPGVKVDPGFAVYDEGLRDALFCRTESGEVYVGQVWPGRTAFPDFARPEAREWWGRLNAAHVRSGLAGIWNDMNEPATGRIPPEAMRFDAGRSSHDRFHNQYALLMAMGTVAGLHEAFPERRTFVLSRAGSAGIQRYAANWLGDNRSRWDHLAASLPMAAGLGVSGQPFVGADIGGFAGDTEAELFVRWMQYGALTPFCRNHTEIGTVEQYAWSFGDAALDAVRDALRLRYRLLPYLYACFVRATETGAPVQRPLVFDHQDDRTVRDVDDEYQLGPDLLVAPVLGPGVTRRSVYLPAGGWYDWHSDQLLDGASWVVADTPRHRIPLYARAGAVVPMWPSAPMSTLAPTPEVVELHLFVPPEGTEGIGMLQEDDGTTLAALSGSRVRTEFRTSRTGDRVRLAAEVDGTGYDGFRRTAFHVVLHGGRPRSAQGPQGPVDVRDGVVVVPDAGAGFVVEIDLTAPSRDPGPGPVV